MGSAATQSAPVVAEPASQLQELLSHSWRGLGLSQALLQSVPCTALPGATQTASPWHDGMPCGRLPCQDSIPPTLQQAASHHA